MVGDTCKMANKLGKNPSPALTFRDVDRMVSLALTYARHQLTRCLPRVETTRDLMCDCFSGAGRPWFARTTEAWSRSRKDAAWGEALNSGAEALSSSVEALRFGNAALRFGVEVLELRR